MKAIKLTPGWYAALVLNGLLLLVFFIDYFFELGREVFLLIAVLGIAALSVFVLRYKQLLLYGLGFLIPLSVPVSIAGGAEISLPAELICVFLSGFFLIKLLIGTRLNRRFLTHPITLLIAADLAWLFISSVFSQMPEASFKRFVIRLCYYITFYYFYQELFRQDRATIKRVFTLHVLGLMIPVIYATIVHAGFGFTTVGSQRISAPFYYDHTIYGACLVFFIPFLIYQSFTPAPLREKMIYRTLLAFFVVATILSYSRAAWLSLAATTLVYLILTYKINYKFLVTVGGLVLAFLFINEQRIRLFLKENNGVSHSNDISMHVKSISNVNTDASNKERINRWKCALRMFADKPLTGFGPGTYQFFYGQYQHREDLTRISTFNGSKGHAHSEYLNYLSETGLPGCLIFVSLIAVVCIRCIRLIKHSKDTFSSQTALYVFAGLLTFFIHAFFNGFLEFDKVAMPVFCSYAAITSLDLAERNV